MQILPHHYNHSTKYKARAKYAKFHDFWEQNEKPQQFDAYSLCICSL